MIKRLEIYKEMGKIFMKFSTNILYTENIKGDKNMVAKSVQMSIKNRITRIFDYVLAFEVVLNEKAQQPDIIHLRKEAHKLYIMSNDYEYLKVENVQNSMTYSQLCKMEGMIDIMLRDYDLIHNGSITHFVLNINHGKGYDIHLLG
jgi:hypothetical protein